jgi:predicted CoA-binding protein
MTEWSGQPCYPNLRAAPGPIEVVDVFRRSELVEPVVEEAIAVGARAVWMQDGVVNPAAAARARAAGLLVVMDRCTMRDHMTLR